MARLLPFTAAAVLIGALAAPSLAQETGAGQDTGTAQAPAPEMGMGMGGMGMGPILDFKAADADGDGKLTRQEMLAYREAHVKAIDKNGDGFVTADELKAEILARMTARADEMAKRGIEFRDDDGDGKLSMTEMAPGQGTGRMFARLDADGDGALTQAEIDSAHDRMMDQRGGHHGWGHGKGHGRGGMFGWWGQDDGAQE